MHEDAALFDHGSRGNKCRATLGYFTAPRRGTKLDFDFLDGVIQGDGSFWVGLHRSKESVSGRLDALTVSDPKNPEDKRVPAGASFFANLSMLIDEAKSGPVPQAESYSQQSVEGKTMLTCNHAGGSTSIIEIGPRSEVISKTLHENDKLLMNIAYRRYDLLDGLKRPKIAKLTFPDNGTIIRMRWRSIDKVPGFKAGTFSYTPPKEWQTIPIDDFVKRLTDKD